MKQNDPFNPKAISALCAMDGMTVPSSMFGALMR